MARKKRLTKEVIADAKQALDDMLRYTPEGHVIVLKNLPEPFRTVLDHMSALGAMFGQKVALRLKDEQGHYKDEMVVFTAAQYRPRPSTSIRRNSRRRGSRRMAAKKRRRTSRHR